MSSFADVTHDLAASLRKFFEDREQEKANETLPLTESEQLDMAIKMSLEDEVVPNKDEEGHGQSIKQTEEEQLQLAIEMSLEVSNEDGVQHSIEENGKGILSCLSFLTTNLFGRGIPGF